MKAFLIEQEEGGKDIAIANNIAEAVVWHMFEGGLEKDEYEHTTVKELTKEEYEAIRMFDRDDDVMLIMDYKDDVEDCTMPYVLFTE
jgi:hypothetical protein